MDVLITKRQVEAMPVSGSGARLGGIFRLSVLQGASNALNGDTTPSMSVHIQDVIGEPKDGKTLLGKTNGIKDPKNGGIGGNLDPHHVDPVLQFEDDGGGMAISSAPDKKTEPQDPHHVDPISQWEDDGGGMAISYTPDAKKEQPKLPLRTRHNEYDTREVIPGTVFYQDRSHRPEDQANGQDNMAVNLTDVREGRALQDEIARIKQVVEGLKEKHSILKVIKVPDETRPGEENATRDETPEEYQVRIAEMCEERLRFKGEWEKTGDVLYEELAKAIPNGTNDWVRHIQATKAMRDLALDDDNKKIKAFNKQVEDNLRLNKMASTVQFSNGLITPIGEMDIISSGAAKEASTPYQDMMAAALVNEYLMDKVTFIQVNGRNITFREELERLQKELQFQSETRDTFKIRKKHLEIDKLRAKFLSRVNNAIQNSAAFTNPDTQGFEMGVIQTLKNLQDTAQTPDMLNELLNHYFSKHPEAERNRVKLTERWEKIFKGTAPQARLVPQAYKGLDWFGRRAIIVSQRKELHKVSGVVTGEEMKQGGAYKYWEGYPPSIEPYVEKRDREDFNSVLLPATTEDGAIVTDPQLYDFYPTVSPEPPFYQNRSESEADLVHDLDSISLQDIREGKQLGAELLLIDDVVASLKGRIPALDRQIIRQKDGKMAPETDTQYQKRIARMVEKRLRFPQNYQDRDVILDQRDPKNPVNIQKVVINDLLFKELQARIAASNPPVDYRKCLQATRAVYWIAVDDENKIIEKTNRDIETSLGWNAVASTVTPSNIGTEIISGLMPIRSPDGKLLPSPNRDMVAGALFYELCMDMKYAGADGKLTTFREVLKNLQTNRDKAGTVEEFITMTERQRMYNAQQDFYRKINDVLSKQGTKINTYSPGSLEYRAFTELQAMQANTNQDPLHYMMEKYFAAHPMPDDQKAKIKVKMEEVFGVKDVQNPKIHELFSYAHKGVDWMERKMKIAEARLKLQVVPSRISGEDYPQGGSYKEWGSQVKIRKGKNIITKPVEPTKPAPTAPPAKTDGEPDPPDPAVVKKDEKPKPITVTEKEVSNKIEIGVSADLHQMNSAANLAIEPGMQLRQVGTAKSLPGKAWESAKNLASGFWQRGIANPLFRAREKNFVLQIEAATGLTNIPIEIVREAVERGNELIPEKRRFRRAINHAITNPLGGNVLAIRDTTDRIEGARWLVEQVNQVKATGHCDSEAITALVKSQMAEKEAFAEDLTRTHQEGYEKVTWLNDSTDPKDKALLDALIGDFAERAATYINSATLTDDDLARSFEIYSQTQLKERLKTIPGGGKYSRSLTVVATNMHRAAQYLKKHKAELIRQEAMQETTKSSGQVSKESLIASYNATDEKKRLDIRIAVAEGIMNPGALKMSLAEEVVYKLRKINHEGAPDWLRQGPLFEACNFLTNVLESGVFNEMTAAYAGNYLGALVTTLSPTSTTKIAVGGGVLAVVGVMTLPSLPIVLPVLTGLGVTAGAMAGIREWKKLRDETRSTEIERTRNRQTDSETALNTNKLNNLFRRFIRRVYGHTTRAEQEAVIAPWKSAKDLLNGMVHESRLFKPEENGRIELNAETPDNVTVEDVKKALRWAAETKARINLMYSKNRRFINYNIDIDSAGPISESRQKEMLNRAYVEVRERLIALQQSKPNLFNELLDGSTTNVNDFLDRLSQAYECNIKGDEGFLSRLANRLAGGDKKLLDEKELIRTKFGSTASTDADLGILSQDESLRGRDMSASYLRARRTAWRFGVVSTIAAISSNIFSTGAHENEVLPSTGASAQTIVHNNLSFRPPQGFQYNSATNILSSTTNPAIKFDLNDYSDMAHLKADFSKFNIAESGSATEPFYSGGVHSETFGRVSLKGVPDGVDIHTTPTGKIDQISFNGKEIPVNNLDPTKDSDIQQLNSILAAHNLKVNILPDQDISQHTEIVTDTLGGTHVMKVPDGTQLVAEAGGKTYQLVDAHDPSVVYAKGIGFDPKTHEFFYDKSYGIGQPGDPVGEINSGQTFKFEDDDAETQNFINTLNTPGGHYQSNGYDFWVDKGIFKIKDLNGLIYEAKGALQDNIKFNADGTIDYPGFPQNVTPDNLLKALHDAGVIKDGSEKLSLQIDDKTWTDFKSQLLGNPKGVKYDNYTDLSKPGHMADMPVTPKIPAWNRNNFSGEQIGESRASGLLLDVDRMKGIVDVSRIFKFGHGATVINDHQIRLFNGQVEDVNLHDVPVAVGQKVVYYDTDRSVLVPPPDSNYVDDFVKAKAGDSQALENFRVVFAKARDANAVGEKLTSMTTVLPKDINHAYVSVVYQHGNVPLHIAGTMEQETYHGVLGLVKKTFTGEPDIDIKGKILDVATDNKTVPEFISQGKKELIEGTVLPLTPNYTEYVDLAGPTRGSTTNIHNSFGKRPIFTTRTIQPTQTKTDLTHTPEQQQTIDVIRNIAENKPVNDAQIDLIATKLNKTKTKEQIQEALKTPEGRTKLAQQMEETEAKNQALDKANIKTIINEEVNKSNLQSIIENKLPLHYSTVENIVIDIVLQSKPEDFQPDKEEEIKNKIKEQVNQKCGAEITDEEQNKLTDSIYSITKQIEEKRVQIFAELQNAIAAPEDDKKKNLTCSIAEVRKRRVLPIQLQINKLKLQHIQEVEKKNVADHIGITIKELNEKLADEQGINELAELLLIRDEVFFDKKMEYANRKAQLALDHELTQLPPAKKAVISQIWTLGLQQLIEPEIDIADENIEQSHIDAVASKIVAEYQEMKKKKLLRQEDPENITIEQANILVKIHIKIAQVHNKVMEATDKDSQLLTEAREEIDHLKAIPNAELDKAEAQYYQDYQKHKLQELESYLKDAKEADFETLFGKKKSDFPDQKTKENFIRELYLAYEIGLLAKVQQQALFEEEFSYLTPDEQQKYQEYIRLFNELLAKNAQGEKVDATSIPADLTKVANALNQKVDTKLQIFATLQKNHLLAKITGWEAKLKVPPKTIKEGYHYPIEDIENVINGISTPAQCLEGIRKNDVKYARHLLFDVNMDHIVEIDLNEFPPNSGECPVRIIREGTTDSWEAQMYAKYPVLPRTLKRKNKLTLIPKTKTNSEFIRMLAYLGSAEMLSHEKAFAIPPYNKPGIEKDAQKYFMSLIENIPASKTSRHESAMMKEMSVLAKTDKILPKETYEQSLKNAIETLKSQDGIVDMKADIPTIVVSDLHTRREFLYKVLNMEIQGQKVSDLLEQGKIRIVCVGDGMHSEVGENWAPYRYQYEVDASGHSAVKKDASGKTLYTEYGELYEQREKRLRKMFEQHPEKYETDATIRSDPAKFNYPNYENSVLEDFNKSTVSIDTELKKKINNVWQREMGKLLPKEMARSLNLMKMIMDLKTKYPNSFHYLRGNHDDIMGGFEKFNHESEMVRWWIKNSFGDDFLQIWAQFENNLPVIVRGKGIKNNFVISHAAPFGVFDEKGVFIRGYTEKEIKERNRKVVGLDSVFTEVADGKKHHRGLTWTNNTEDLDCVAKAVPATLQNLSMPANTLWLIGHRPTYNKFRSQLEGQLIQINKQDKHIIAVIQSDRSFDPEQDVIEL